MTLPTFNSGQSISLQQIRDEFGINSSSVTVFEPSSTTFFYNRGSPLYYWRDAPPWWAYRTGFAGGEPLISTGEVYWNGVLITSSVGAPVTIPSYTTGGITYIKGPLQSSGNFLGYTISTGIVVRADYYSIQRSYQQVTNTSDPAPYNISDYRAGAASGYVVSGVLGFPKPSGASTAIPASPSEISFNNFFGATRSVSYSITRTVNYVGVYNVRQQLLAAGWNGTDVIIATVTINAGVYIYRSQYDTSAFSIASVEIQGFPAGSVINLVNNGFIYGFGGQGGNGGNMSGAAAGSTGTAGNPGGTGLYVSASGYTVRVTNNGTIAGGGGGGGGGGSAYLFVPSDGKNAEYTVGAGGGGGGGGAPNGNGGSRAIISGYVINYNATIAGGSNAVFPNSPGNGQTGVGGPPFGGSGNIGGTVGNAGSPGTSSTSGTSNGGGGAGGAAGAAVQGNSFITWLAFGTRIGAIT